MEFKEFKVENCIIEIMGNGIAGNGVEPELCWREDFNQSEILNL